MKSSRKLSPNKINLGSGKIRLDGWLNVDLVHSDSDMNLGSFPWPIRASNARRILASHVLEHFSKDDGVRFLEECHRVMRKGGVLHIAVPDMDKFIECRLSNDFGQLKVTNEYGHLVTYRWTDLNHLMGGDVTEAKEEMKHKYMYSFESLAYVLEKLGFEVTRRAEPLEEDNDDYKHITLYVDAVKQ